MAIRIVPKQAPKPAPVAAPKRKRAPGAGRKKAADPKVSFSLRLEQSVLARWQAYPDWRARMNDALKRHAPLPLKGC